MIKSLLFLSVILWLGGTIHNSNPGQKDYKLRIEKGRLVSVDTFPTSNGSIEKIDTFYIWDVPVTLTNRTSDTLKYLSMFCSWDEFYITDNDKLSSWTICDKNFPIMEVLAPGESIKRDLLLMRDDNSFRVTFKVGFNLIRVNSDFEAWNFDFRNKETSKNIIWSNKIRM